MTECPNCGESIAGFVNPDGDLKPVRERLGGVGHICHLGSQHSDLAGYQVMHQ